MNSSGSLRGTGRVCGSARNNQRSLAPRAVCCTPAAGAAAGELWLAQSHREYGSRPKGFLSRCSRCASARGAFATRRHGIASSHVVALS